MRQTAPVRFSDLRVLGTRSPAHVMVEREETAAMARGSALHAMVFGTQRVVCYDGIRRGRDWEEFRHAHEGSLILPVKEYDKASYMADAVRAHKFAAEALKGTTEERFEWDYAGLLCAGTPDCHQRARVADLKGVRCSDPRYFVPAALRSGHHAQLTWYAEGLRIAKKADPVHHYLVAVEAVAPFPVVVYQLSERAIEAGNKLWRLWFERYKTCLESGAWPSYTEAVEVIDVPDETALIFGDDAETLEEVS